MCFLAPFFVAHTAVLRRVGFDESLPTGALEDFFLRAKDSGVKVAACHGEGYYLRDDPNERCAAWGDPRRRHRDAVGAGGHDADWEPLFVKHRLASAVLQGGGLRRKCTQGENGGGFNTERCAIVAD